MRIKIKTTPEDFIVDEIASLPLRKKGEFGTYLLQKRGWNTVGILLKLSKDLNIPYNRFSYGGKKDKYGLTNQYITIRGERLTQARGMDYSLKFCGYMDRPMGPDLIEANKFKITVRNLKEQDVQLARSKAKIIKSIGYPNYFDDQRFGSFDAQQGFFAEKILKKHFNGALKIHMTSINKEDKKQEKERRVFFIENWSKWKVCLERAQTDYERRAFDFLVKNPKGILSLLKQIPREQLSIYFSAYQANLWNEVLRRLIKERSDLPLERYLGIAGEYLFYTKIDQKNLNYLESLGIPTLASKMIFSDDAIARIYSCVMEESGISKSLFNKIKLRQVYFKSTLRCAIVKPEELKFETTLDELHAGRKKVILNFSLPRGSYATMLLKRLFCEAM